MLVANPKGHDPCEIPLDSAVGIEDVFRIAKTHIFKKNQPDEFYYLLSHADGKYCLLYTSPSPRDS